MKQHLLGSVVCLDLNKKNLIFSTITAVDTGKRIAELTINGNAGNDKILISIVDLNHPDVHLLAKWFVLKSEFKELPSTLLTADNFVPLFEVIAERLLYEN